MATRTHEVPQPTHGGVYEFVDGQLRVIEGGPPAQAKPPAADKPAPAPAKKTTGEGA